MKIYTGVGSRDIPKQAYDILASVAAKLDTQGWTLRSGGAEGADTAFEEASTRKEIYIPWDGYNDRETDLRTVFRLSDGDYEGARQIASTIHPNWNRLSNGVKCLHARNVYQVLGLTLDMPSKFLVCYAPTGWDHEVIGGTRTAVVLAQEWGIPVFNIHYVKDSTRLLKFLEA